MSWAQRGVGGDAREAKQQLLVHRAVARDCKIKKAYMCTAWIDYKTVYDNAIHMDTGVLAAL